MVTGGDMTALVEVEEAPALVEDNPKIPVKAIIAAVVAAVTYLAGLGLDLPEWVEVLIGMVLVGGAVFLGKNPKRIRAGVRPQPRKAGKQGPRQRGHQNPGGPGGDVTGDGGSRLA